MPHQITKRFTFEASHRLTNHDGKCSRNHGHSYKLFVTVEGPLDRNIISPKEGMVMDFGDLSAVVKEAVIDKWDHHFLANGDEPEMKALPKDDIALIRVRTTAENMSSLIFRILEAAGINVCEVTLYETETSYATYRH